RFSGAARLGFAVAVLAALVRLHAVLRPCFTGFVRRATSGGGGSRSEIAFWFLAYIWGFGPLSVACSKVSFPFTGQNPKCAGKINASRKAVNRAMSWEGLKFSNLFGIVFSKDVRSKSLKLKESKGLLRLVLDRKIPPDMVASIDNVRGLTLAMSSSAFIGSSFVIKKVGLKKAGDNGVRAASGGFSYLYEPLWWLGMITMILGEVANFAAYAFAPAVLVTPLGALSIIFSAVLAHFILKENLHMFGVVGCILCVVGSVGIVLHAPKERKIDSMKEIWHLATQPGFIVYSCVAVACVLFLIFRVVERSGHRLMLVYIAICSLMGSLTVISVKAVAIALKLSFNGSNQFIYVQTWFFIVVVTICCLVQLNYLNKALDSFNTAVVSPVYYVMFTILTIVANMIMYKDWASQTATQIATQLCGFVTIVAGTFLLHKTRDMGNPPPPDQVCLEEARERDPRSMNSSS
ncbi:unnamed protein product, partial [Urochloa humidicola]